MVVVVVSEDSVITSPLRMQGAGLRFEDQGGRYCPGPAYGIVEAPVELDEPIV